jgi:hypothetical protein
MRFHLYWILLVSAGTAWAQEGDAPADPPAEEAPAAEPAEEADEEGTLMKAVELRGRVREMRRSVIGGGPAVEKAEKEAMGFYRRMISRNASRVDELRTQRDAKDAEYRLALDATLEANDKATSDAAARRAASLRKEIGDLDAEIEELVRQRDQLGAAVASIQRRMDRRRRIMEHFDAGEEIETLPFLGEDVLGPDEEGLGGDDPFANSAFLEDLMRRDPARARLMLFQRDPVRYWKLFPLTRPEGTLRKAIPFPPPDLPGK